jgi:phosphomethylpyrimidine synthase
MFSFSLSVLPVAAGDGEGDQPQAGGGVGAAPELDPIEAEAGMAEMSEKFREKGGEIYLPAAE